MLTRIIRNDRGQELVEYAIVLFVLMTLILGIIEFGIIVFTQNSLSNAAREGARWSVVRRNLPAPDTYLPSVGSSDENVCSSPSNPIASLGACPRALGLDPAKVGVIISRPSSAEISVRVSYDYSPFFGLFDSFFPDGVPVPLGSQSTMRLE